VVAGSLETKGFFGVCKYCNGSWREQAIVRPEGTFQAMTASGASSAVPLTAGIQQ